MPKVLRPRNALLDFNTTFGNLPASPAIPKVNRFNGSTITSSASSMPIPQLPRYCSSGRFSLHPSPPLMLSQSREMSPVRAALYSPNGTDVPTLNGTLTARSVLANNGSWRSTSAGTVSPYWTISPPSHLGRAIPGDIGDSLGDSGSGGVASPHSGSIISGITVSVPYVVRQAHLLYDVVYLIGLAAS